MARKELSLAERQAAWTQFWDTVFTETAAQLERERQSPPATPAAPPAGERRTIVSCASCAAKTAADPHRIFICSNCRIVALDNSSPD